MRRFPLRPAQAVPGGFRQTIVLPAAPTQTPAVAAPSPAGDGCPFWFVVAQVEGATDDPLTIPVSAAVQCYGVPWEPGMVERIVCGGAYSVSPEAWGWDTVTINGVSDAIQNGNGETVSLGGFSPALVSCKGDDCLRVSSGHSVTFSGGARPAQTFPLYVINDTCF